MATVNFSVPQDVKDAFDAAFAGRNKSAVIAVLMRQAVEERARQTRREQLFQALTSGRSRRPAAATAKIREVRRAARS